MSTRQVIGYAIIASVFAGLYLLFAYAVGFLVALVPFVIVALIFVGSILTSCPPRFVTFPRDPKLPSPWKMDEPFYAHLAAQKRRIAELEEQLEAHCWKMTPGMYEAKIAELNSKLEQTAWLRWQKITEQLPSRGDIIACCAPHRDGGLMFWAGRVIHVENGFATMETRGEETRRFVITYDTFWIAIPLEAKLKA